MASRVNLAPIVCSVSLRSPSRDVMLSAASCSVVSIIVSFHNSKSKSSMSVQFGRIGDIFLLGSAATDIGEWSFLLLHICLLIQGEHCMQDYD